LGKTNEIKVWYYWEHLGEYIEKLGNVLGFKNTLGTKRIEINPTHPCLPQKKPGMYIVSLHWLNIIYILAFVYCHFQPSLMARTYN
jgi:hypothetical protein